MCKTETGAGLDWGQPPMEGEQNLAPDEAPHETSMHEWLSELEDMWRRMVEAIIHGGPDKMPFMGGAGAVDWRPDWWVARGEFDPCLGGSVVTVREAAAKPIGLAGKARLVCDIREGFVTGDEEHVAVRGNQLNRARPLIPQTIPSCGRRSLRTQTTALSTRPAVRAGERRATTG